LYDCISCPLYFFWTPDGFSKNCPNIKYDESMCSDYLTVFCVHSISFVPLIEFLNNSKQMSSIMSQCAIHMFDQSRFKVKVIVQCLTLYDCTSCPLYIFWTLQMSSKMSQCVVRMFDQGQVKVIVQLLWLPF